MHSIRIPEKCYIISHFRCRSCRGFIFYSCKVNMDDIVWWIFLKRIELGRSEKGNIFSDSKGNI